MSEQIIDGTGNSYRAKVGESHRLFVASRSSDAEEIAARNERAFILHCECHVSADASGAFLAFRNDSSDILYAVSRIYIDSHSLSDDLIVRQVKNPTRSGGTDISATGIVNKNYASNREVTGTLWHSDSGANLTLSGGSKYHAFPVTTLKQYTRDMRGTNILGKNDVIGWTWSTVDLGNAVDGEIVSFSVNIYEIPTEEVE